MIEWNEVIRRDSFLPGIEVVSVGYRRTKFGVLIPKRFSPRAVAAGADRGGHARGYVSDCRD
jgi:hypothetical protein